MASKKRTRDPLNVRIGKRLRDVRMRVRMSQREAAEFVFGVRTRQGEWSQWESGDRRPNLATLERIAKAFGVSLASFGVSADQKTLSDSDLEEAYELLEKARDLTERAMEILGRGKT